MTTRSAYLHEEGWTDSLQPLHQQPWVRDAMAAFQHKQQKWEHRQCQVCRETWPTRVTLTAQPYVCTRCKRDKRAPKLFSAENDMHPGRVPACLENLTQIEEMLIARASPIMCVYRKKGGQRGYSGHVLNLPQDVQGFLDKLPCNVSDLPVLVVRRHGSDNTHKDCRVRRARVLGALEWLKTHNTFYADIEIDIDALQRLPSDGVPEELLTIREGSKQHHDGSSPSDDSEDEGPPHTEGLDSQDVDSLQETNSYSFMPLPQQQRQEEDAIRALVNGDDPLDWPTITGQPINEFRTDGLATKVFPALFPYGTGDPTCKGRRHEVKLTECFKHLIRYGDTGPDSQQRWRFASHPRFPYWALNMKQRHQLLSQAKVYLHQNPRDAHLTVEELRAMVGQMRGEQLMKRIQRYAAKLPGTHQYWFQRYLELRSLLEQKGAATFFWTVSSADTYWPDLHALMPHPQNEQVTHQMRIQAVISNPHLTDWYFCNRLKDFVNHWLLQVLDVEWYWYRCEYQARGSTHAHGCAKLKNDPDLCRLVKSAAAGWVAKQKQPERDSGNCTIVTTF